MAGRQVVISEQVQKKVEKLESQSMQNFSMDFISEEAKDTQQNTTTISQEAMLAPFLQKVFQNNLVSSVCDARALIEGEFERCFKLERD